MQCRTNNELLSHCCYEESKQSCLPKYQSLLSCHWMCAAFVLARSGQNKDFCCQVGLAGQRTDPDSKCGKRWFRRFVHRDGDLAADRERLVHEYNLQFTSFVLALCFGYQLTIMCGSCFDFSVMPTNKLQLLWKVWFALMNYVNCPSWEL